MSEENENTNETPQSQPSQADTKTFTQAELNTLMGRARNEGREKGYQAALAEIKPPKAAEPKPEATTEALDVKALVSDVTSSVMTAVRNEMKGQTLDTLIATSSMGEEAQELLRAKFEVDKPADTAAWFSKWSPVLGGTTPNNNSEGNAVADPSTATTTVPRRVERLEKDGYIDVFELSDEQIEEMGMDEVVKHYERARDAGKRSSGAPRLPKFLRSQQG